jgi:hypothetical protein
MTYNKPNYSFPRPSKIYPNCDFWYANMNAITRLPDSSSYNIPKWGNVLNLLKVYQMALKYI